jgi:vacuolar-type H+-ATPase subunit H
MSFQDFEEKAKKKLDQAKDKTKEVVREAGDKIEHAAS